MRKFSKNSGFMVVELLIGVSIITVSIFAAMIVAQKSINVSRQALHVSQASFLLEEGAEAVRIVRDNAWSNISNLTASASYYPNFSGGTWVLDSNLNTIGIFTRNVSVSAVNRDDTTKDIVTSGGTTDAGTRLVTVTVSWLEGATTVSKSIQFYIMDIFS